MKTIALQIVSNINANGSTLAAISSYAQLKEAMGSVIGLLVLLSFLVALAFLIIGIIKNDGDPAAAKKAFITAGLLAAAPALVTILFVIFGSSGATVAPNFQ